MDVKLGTRGLALWLACAAAPALAAPKETLTLEQAVELAKRQNPRMRAARSSTAADADQARSVRGHLLPTVDVSVMADDAWSFQKLNIGGLLGPFFAGGQAGAQGSGPSFPPPAAISNAWIGLGTATVAQPLLGLWHLGHEYAGALDHADASAATLKADEADLREQVESSFLSLFEARALEGIAQASYSQLQDQDQLTEAKYRDGVLTRADVLRVKVAVANADQQRIQAQVQEQVAKASLLTILGLPPADEDVDFTEPTSLATREIPTLEASAQTFALEHRQEVVASEAQRSAAHHSFVASELHLLPEINASAMYIHVQGLPSAIPSDFGTIGFTLDWPIWQWGSTYYQSRVASERADAAAALLENTRAQVSLEVDQRLAEERAAAHAVVVAQDAIQQAEEAYRVTESMVKAGAATTTDLLDAQSALTQAKLNLVRARYQDLRTRSALTRALGA